MKFLILAIKLAITGALIWVLVTHVNFAPIGHFLQSQRAIGAVALCIGILVAQAGLASLRVRWIMRLMGAEFSLGLGFSTWMIGLLVSQTMVTFIAGDAARIWQFTRRGYGRRLSGSAIFLERALGFAVLMGLVLVCVPLLLDRAPAGHVRTGLLVVAALCAAGITGFVASAFFGKVIARLAPRIHDSRIAAALVDITSAARHLGESWPLTLGVVGLSIVMHLCNALTFYILGTAAHIDLDLFTTIAIALPVMLISLLPIALAGWGVREGSAVVGYGLFGVSPESALTVSVAFGLALLIASLPGALFLWHGKPRHGQHEAPATSAQIST